MPMYETTVRTPQGEEKKRIYANTPQEAKKLFEQLYGGPRAVPYIPHVVPSQKNAGVAQLVEHYLAKVDVEGSNPFARSNNLPGQLSGSSVLLTSGMSAVRSRHQVPK